MAGQVERQKKWRDPKALKWPPVAHFRRGHAVNQTHARDSSYRIWLPSHAELSAVSEEPPLPRHIYKRCASEVLPGRLPKGFNANSIGPCYRPHEQIASNRPVYALSGQLQRLNQGKTPRYPRVILALFLAFSLVIPYQLFHTSCSAPRPDGWATLPGRSVLIVPSISCESSRQATDKSRGIPAEATRRFHDHGGPVSRHDPSAFRLTRRLKARPQHKFARVRSA